MSNENTLSTQNLCQKIDVVLSPFNEHSILMYHKLKLDGFNVIRFGDGDAMLYKSNYDGVPITPVYFCGEQVVICKSNEINSEDIKGTYNRRGALANLIFHENEIITTFDNYDVAALVDVLAFSKLRPLPNYHQLPKSGCLYLKKLQQLSKNKKKSTHGDCEYAIFPNVQWTS